MRTLYRSAIVLVIVMIPVTGFAQGRPWDPQGMQLKAYELAPGVYQIAPSDVLEKDHTGTTAGVIVGEKGVLVVDALINGDLASQLIGQIRAITPLPIRYLVNTSFHGDHVYGNYVFPQETTVIHHGFTKHYIESKFEEDRQFMLSIMGAGRGLETVQPRSADVAINDKIMIDLGGRKVEIFYLGFVQTDGDLIIRLPKENIIFVGNMVQAPPPALPWLLEGRPEEAAKTLRRLFDLLDDETVIVPGHGRPMHRNDIQYSMQYMAELKKEIEAAVDRGLTLEQAQEAVAMEEYAGYSLFPFAHKQINIPAVYREAAVRKNRD